MERWKQLKNLKFDSEKLRKEFDSIEKFAFYGKIKKTGLHTAYTEARDIVSQFPEGVVENAKFLKTLAGGIVHSHIDSRNVAINIPVTIHETSMVEFFEGGEEEEVVLRINGKRQKTNAKNVNNAVKVGELFLDMPIILNTGLTHGVNNINSPYDRVILSISLTEKYDNWEDACTVLSTLM